MISIRAVALASTVLATSAAVADPSMRGFDGRTGFGGQGHEAP